MIVVTISDILSIAILAITLGSFLIYLLYLILIEPIIHKLFMNNCYKCKHWRFYSTRSFGDYCDYKCLKKDKKVEQNMNSKEHWCKCKDYEEGAEE